jgi:CRP-like cAMP-binding protein
MKPGTLKNQPLFSRFLERELELLEALFVTEKFVRGNVFVKQGGHAKSMRSAVYLLLEGEVHIARDPSGTDRSTFETTIEPPQLFGIISLATGQPHSATCTAQTNCVVAHLDRPAFLELRSNQTALSARFEHLLARQLVHDMRRLTDGLLGALKDDDRTAVSDLAVLS